MSKLSAMTTSIARGFLVLLLVLSVDHVDSVSALALGGNGNADARSPIIARASSGSSDLRRYMDIADDATSPSNPVFYPGTRVPEDVITHLMAERHGVNNHVPMVITPGYEGIARAKLRELLFHPTTPVLGMQYNGEQYFLTRSRPLEGSSYPAWGDFVRPTARIDRNAMHAIFIGKVREGAEPGHEFDLLAIRSPATPAERQTFFDRMGRMRNYVHFTNLL